MQISSAGIPELRIELGPTVASVERAARRLTDLLAGVEDPDRRLRRLEWTMADLAAHLAARTALFTGYLTGSATPEGEIADIAAENDRQIRERASRPHADHVEELRANVSAFVAATRGRLGADPFPWYSGLTLDVATGTGILLAELLVHGFDAARTLGRRWPIAAGDARTIVRASVVLAPHYVDPQAARGVRTTFRVALRGGPSFRIRIDDGAAEVLPPRGEADTTIRADPASFVHVAYGRVSKWRAFATGRLVPTGRRPWRALAFDRLFLPP